MSDSGIVVTGASSGIGRAIAIRLAKAQVRESKASSGRMLVHYCSNRSGAKETAAAVGEIGMGCEILQADLGLPDQVDRMATEAFNRLGKISVWVNNAGSDVLTGEAKDWSFDQKLRQLLDVDLRGTVALSRHVSESLLRQTKTNLGAPARHR